MFLRLAASVGFEAADLVRVVEATEKIVGARSPNDILETKVIRLGGILGTAPSGHAA